MMRALESSVQRALNDSLESFDRLSTKGYQSEIREKLFLHADLVEALLAFFSSLLGACRAPRRSSHAGELSSPEVRRAPVAECLVRPLGVVPLDPALECTPGSSKVAKLRCLTPSRGTSTAVQSSLHDRVEPGRAPAQGSDFQFDSGV
jgi:hypothetical protein